VIVHVLKNRLQYYEPLFEALAAAAAKVVPGEVVHVGKKGT
jgi:hypothetical protein